jgi:hypothetical protein
MKTENQTDFTSGATVRRILLAKGISLLLLIAAIVAGLAYMAPVSGHAGEKAGHPIFVKDVPEGYRDWKLISVAHEEGNLTDIRAILGNDIALKAYREKSVPFPEGTIIARIAWSHDESEENNRAFAPFLKQGYQKSFVAGSPTNGVQFMIKDSKKYAATGGWGYGQFDDGKPVAATMLQNCFRCHQVIKERDFIFTRYAP